jgi:probable poly-beta-1,6-N-acetyl-D-glucosamine export protein
MSKRLLLLNGLAIIGVVMNHASFQGFIAMFWWTDRYRPVEIPNFDQLGSLSYYTLVAAQKLGVFSVPAFLFVTGIFVAYASRGNKFNFNWKMAKNRIIYLVPPYFVWFGILLINDFIFGIHHTLEEFLILLMGLGNAPLFYVPLLLQIYLLAPILTPLAKKSGKIVLIAAGIVSLAFIIQSYIVVYSSYVGKEAPLFPLFRYNLPTAHLLEYGPYFVLGLVVGFNYNDFRQYIIRWRWVIFTTLVTCAFLAVIEAEVIYRVTGLISIRSMVITLPSMFFALSFICCFLAFEKVKLPLSNMLYVIGASSLGIYLIHHLVLFYLPKFVYHLAPFLLEQQFLYMPLLISAGLGLPIIIMRMSKFTIIQKYHRYLYG